MTARRPNSCGDSAPATLGAPASAAELLVAGQVQGVGFRPFVHRLATGLGLTGCVRNDPSGVAITLYGPAANIHEFARRLTSEPPPLSRVFSVIRRDLPNSPSVPASFTIAPSDRDGRPDRVTVDSATCSDCLRELLDPRNRRFRHALINCTNCGPRFTIVRNIPYDRPFTTMAGFPMCPACASEYRDPADRRFHAQPTCCHSCGPSIRFIDDRARGATTDAISAAADLLKRGGVLAIKGLGGYHLAVDAANPAAVDLLRRRKHRDHKPLAVMADTIGTAASLVDLSPQAREALAGPVAPIVLSRRRSATAIAAGVAPGVHRLGVMLPHTPLQHLLMRESLRTLVMTSANLSDDPLMIDDDDARQRLTGIADARLTHDRPIERAVDDSVLLDTPLGLVPIRRARGLAPAPVQLPRDAGLPGLCLGGELKSAIAVVSGGQATMSQHLGDLSYTLAYERFRTTSDDFLRLFRIEPRWIARDAHPAYLSHRYAASLARKMGAQIVDVQHHHAHFAAGLAEHQHHGPAVGLVCDGVGYGDDGSSWGGEVLVGDLVACARRGRLRPLSLPGGDAAARQTGRCAMAWLYDAFGASSLAGPWGARVMPAHHDRRMIASMLARDLNCPTSSGLGRLFDAAAAVLGVCDHNHYEAMSGLTLEALADGADPTGEGRDLVPLVERDGLLEMDHRPLARRLTLGVDHGEPIERLARLFHEAVAFALADAGAQAAAEHHLRTVVLSGGAFCNALLTQLVHDGLSRQGLDVLVHRVVPPNDGGLALGQAAVAAARCSHPGQGV